jgi:hypothetical protein
LFPQRAGRRFYSRSGVGYSRISLFYSRALLLSLILVIKQKKTF